MNFLGTVAVCILKVWNLFWNHIWSQSTSHRIGRWYHEQLVDQIRERLVKFRRLPSSACSLSLGIVSILYCRFFMMYHDTTLRQIPSSSWIFCWLSKNLYDESSLRFWPLDLSFVQFLWLRASCSWTNCDDNATKGFQPTTWTNVCCTITLSWWKNPFIILYPSLSLKFTVSSSDARALECLWERSLAWSFMSQAEKLNSQLTLPQKKAPQPQIQGGPPVKNHDNLSSLGINHAAFFRAHVREHQVDSILNMSALFTPALLRGHLLLSHYHYSNEFKW